MASENDKGQTNIEQLLESGVMTEEDIDRLTPAGVAKINGLPEGEVQTLIEVRMQLLDSSNPPSLGFRGLYV